MQKRTPAYFLLSAMALALLAGCGTASKASSNTSWSAVTLPDKNCSPISVSESFLVCAEPGIIKKNAKGQPYVEYQANKAYSR